MKTYKTIDLLYGGYNGKIFKNNFKNIKTGEIIEQGKYPRLECFYFIETGKNIFENIDGNFKTDSLRQLLNQEWAVIPQPVDAITALTSGKSIKAILEGSYESDYQYIDFLLKDIANSLTSIGIVRLFKNGKWYIKEDEE